MFAGADSHQTTKHIAGNLSGFHTSAISKQTIFFQLPMQPVLIELEIAGVSWSRMFTDFTNSSLQGKLPQDLGPVTPVLHTSLPCSETESEASGFFSLVLGCAIYSQHRQRKSWSQKNLNPLECQSHHESHTNDIILYIIYILYIPNRHG
jgi:hypothetical protein